jgi:hypothetical protein
MVLVARMQLNGREKIVLAFLNCGARISVICEGYYSAP